MKKFYVGAQHIGAAIGRDTDAPNMFGTLDEAIEEGKTLLRHSTSKNTNCLVIVQVVKVLRREVPISVEDPA